MDLKDNKTGKFLKYNVENVVKKEFCVISHTHWDREWYQPFEKFRMRLCDLINNLFKILEDYPKYIFHLDAQTIVLEDYLEVYPENREKLENYIRSGNIIVGPWYVQNDFYLSSGESTVRNLLIGTELAESFGKCANIGYTPDQFGLCSQLPQIFNEFGIEYHLFGRGYEVFTITENGAEQVKNDINFWWQSPNGSKVNSTLMPFWYNNAQRIPNQIESAVSSLGNMERRFAERTECPYLIMMNGVDHLEAQDDLLPILGKINKTWDDKRIAQCNMEDVLKLNAPYAKDVISGELRYGGEGHILSGTLSSRTDIKKLNFDTQNMIEHKVEPLYAMIKLLGADIYPKNQIKLMWKMLIPNHAHDSICCCSTPNVMKHMQDRYLSINEIGEELILRGSRFINHHIERDSAEKGVYYLTVINTNQTNYTGVMECEMDINICDADGDFKIYTSDGMEVEYSIINKEKAVFSTFSPLNLPGSVDVVNYKIQFYVKDVPAFGYSNYIVRTGYEHQEAEAVKVLENEFIKVDFDNDTVNMLDKKNSKYYSDILSFEDVGDAGEAYIFQPFAGDVPVKASLEKKEIEYANSVKSAVRLYYSFDVPEGKDEKTRAGKIVRNTMEVVLSLGIGDEALSVDVKLNNNSKYHLTKAIINTGIDNTITYASSVYDIIERDSKDIMKEIRTCGSQPNNGFVYKKTDTSGVVIYTKGIYEYENEENELVKLSLLRSTDLIASGGVIDPKAWGVKDNLMLGTVNLSFAIMPFDGNNSCIPAKEQNINCQPIYYFDSTDIHMFTGGRPVVQDGDVGKLYFTKDEYENMKLPHKKGILEISEGVCVTALKKAETTDGVILRAYNPSEHKKESILELSGKELFKTNLAETMQEAFENCIGKKEIKTILIK